MISILTATLKSYTGPVGNLKNGVDMKDNSYDGELNSDGLLHDGVGKLTDDMYGSKKSAEIGDSPWVAYKDGSPTVTFHFKEKKVIKQIMIHVNNNNNDVKVFRQVKILTSNDEITYTSVKTYETNNEQRSKIDAYPVVCHVGDAVAKHVKLKFIKGDEWLLISEIVVMTDAYPSKPTLPNKNLIHTTESVKYTRRPKFTFDPDGYNGNNGNVEKEKSNDKGKGKSCLEVHTVYNENFC